MTNTVYSDGTPTISIVYNRAGQQIEAHDAAGVTTFAYDDFGAVTNETVIGVLKGACNSVLDACPFVGWGKLGAECIWGDWFPDNEDHRNE